MNIIFSSNENCKYFVRLYPKEFWALYEWLGPAKFYLTSKKIRDDNSGGKFTISEEMFLTLLRLRRGWNIFTLAHIYGCSSSYIKKIFLTWVTVL